MSESSNVFLNTRKMDEDPLPMDENSGQRMSIFMVSLALKAAHYQVREMRLGDAFLRIHTSVAWYMKCCLEMDDKEVIISIMDIASRVTRIMWDHLDDLVLLELQGLTIILHNLILDVAIEKNAEASYS